MQLTGTNSSIGLIVLIARAHLLPHACSALSGAAPGGPRKGEDARSRLRALPGGVVVVGNNAWKNTSFSLQLALCRPGGYGGVAAPDPIPNSAVKRPSADGTLSQGTGE
jgi:hypothetical protein